MSTPIRTHRLSPQTLSQDTDALNGLRTIATYSSSRPEASSDAIQRAYQKMLAAQQTETERQILAKAAVNAARQAEWEFHNAIIAMKQVVRGQYGLDSDEAQAVGLKKRSNYKRPRRSAKKLKGQEPIAS